MTINIGGASLEGDGSTVTIKNTSGTTLFSRGFDTYSNTTYAKMTENLTPAFIAGPGSGVTAEWNNYATNNWAKVNNNCETTVINVGNHYSTSNTRFTAPISGAYLFMYTGYDYAASYWHPQFTVNGSTSTRRAAIPYRIRQHGMVTNRQQDSMMQEIIYLVPNDYVEVYFYAGGAGYRYSKHNLFMGFYVG